MLLNKEEINFWKKNQKNLDWISYPKKIYNFDKKNNRFKWFEDGNLNACYNVIDRNILKGLKNKSAIKIADNKGYLMEYTYGQLYIFINNFCKVLKNNYNLKEIKNVMIHGSTSIEVIVSMLSCARLGITHCVVFQELSIDAINKRIKIFDPDLFITIDNEINLKKIGNKIPKIRFTKHKVIKKKKNLINLHDQLNEVITNHIKCKKVPSDSNFFTLFTSGTTGEPKGIVHSLGGFLVYNSFSCKYHFGINEKTIMLNTSNPGWINGNNYAVYGPLLFGATIILFENPSILLNINYLKLLLKKNKITIVYLPVTLIRMMRSLYLNSKIKSKHIITLGSMGEHLARNIAEWYSTFFSIPKKAIVNGYYQTENGSILSSPTFKENINTAPHGSIGRPHRLIKLRLIKKINNYQKYEFVVKKPWPGCMKMVLNGKKVWSKYWDKSNFFKLYDYGYKIKNNYYANGRTDDVINIRGHRIGTAEVEAVVLQSDKVYEVAAVSVEDKVSGSELVLFIVSNTKNLNDKIDKIIINNFGKFAIPKKIYYVKSLPKTRSGKILRRILKNIITINNIDTKKDMSTIQNPETINEIIKTIKS